MSEEYLTAEDFGRGIKKRLPIMFCLDVSGSMKGDRIRKLNDAMKIFVDSVSQNSDTALSADIGIVTFGGYVEILRKMMQVGSAAIPDVQVREKSLTPMGEAINVSLDILEKRKEGYKSKGLKYFQPWIVLITDGKPEGENAAEEMENAIARLNELEKNNKLVVFNIGIDDEVDNDILKRVSVKRQKQINLSSDDLGNMFQYLGASSSKVVVGQTDTSELYKNTLSNEKPSDIRKEVMEIDFNAYEDI